MKTTISLFAISILLIACSKVEGQGGTSKIAGKIEINDYNATGTSLVATYAGADESVYLIYGENKTFYDDEIKTSYDGSFEFPFLKKGKYTFFVYEDCNSCASGQKVILKTVEITENNQTIDLGTIDVKKI